MAAATMPATHPTSGLRLHRMSCATYERIVELGFYGPRDKIVLLDGLLVEKRGKDPRRVYGMMRGQQILEAAAPAGWYVRSQQPVVLRGGPAGDSVPEPDLVIVFGDIERYEERHPTGSEVGAVLEVFSVREALADHRADLIRYAHAGISVAGIINMTDRSVEVHTEPSGPSATPGYAKYKILRPGQFFAAAIDNATTGPAAIAPIPIESFFPPA